jgi:phosphoribosyl 1,2-cyclic phosphodiesterase
MSLLISSLNSGSNGNCYYIGNDHGAVLIDVGISCREVERRMKRLDLPIENVKAIFISHEHGDHIRGVEVLSKKHQLPVYITTSTLLYSGLKINPSLVSSFKAYEPITIQGLSVTAFPKFHDASDPHSFVVEGNGTKIGVLTDIGSNCKHVIENFKQCHAAFLETNYDEKMLEEGAYPYHLKRRIRSDRGHLSNDQALDLFKKHRPKFMSHLLLSHLSKNNNCPKLVYDLFSQHAGSTTVVVASRDEESAVYRIFNNNPAEIQKKRAEERQALLNRQMTLF